MIERRHERHRVGDHQRIPRTDNVQLDRAGNPVSLTDQAEQEREFVGEQLGKNARRPGQQTSSWLTGHADARYVFQQVGVELDQDVEVFSSPEAVQTDFSRTISPGLGRCLEYQLGKLAHVADVSVTRVPFPPTGSVSAVFRAELTVKTSKGLGRLVSDYVFFGAGRTEYEFTVIAPADSRDQLLRFELGLARILLRRAGIQPA